MHIFKQSDNTRQIPIIPTKTWHNNCWDILGGKKENHFKEPKISMDYSLSTFKMNM